MRLLPPRWLGRALTFGSRFVSTRTRRMWQALPFFLAYLADEQEFDDSNSRGYFAAAGFEVPAVEDYLETVLDYYWTAQAKRQAPALAGRRR
jgi:hypothetical protein